MPVRLLAAALVALEAVGLAILLVWQTVALIGGDTASLPSALALLVLTLVGTIAVGGFAVATARGRSWARSGAIVVQLLILAIALGEFTGSAANASLAVAIAVPGVIGLVLLLLAAREAARAPRD